MYRPLEFYGHGALREESRTRMEEAVDILLQAWTQEKVNYTGKLLDDPGVRARFRGVRPELPRGFRPRLALAG